ncbi:MAG: pilus assembly protein [Gemmataceae bacterium]|nr:pilus assembly protein [Gemmataceae bacterium]
MVDSIVERRLPGRRGQVLIEFALVALILFSLLALTFDFGRAVVSAQVTQQAADHVAHGLAIAVVNSGDKNPDPANALKILEDNKIFSEDFLVIDITAQPLDPSKLPSGNRLLVPLMIVMDQRQNPNIPAGARWLIYPGELVPSGTAPTGFKVVVPKVNYQSGAGKIGEFPVVQVAKLEVIEGAKPSVQADVSVFYPFQAAAISGRASEAPPATPQDAYIEVPAGEQLQPGELGGPYSGASGLGRQAAFTKTVRPYRRVIEGMGSRREVYAP